MCPTSLSEVIIMRSRTYQILFGERRNSTSARFPTWAISIRVSNVFTLDFRLFSST